MTLKPLRLLVLALAMSLALFPQAARKSTPDAAPKATAKNKTAPSSAHKANAKKKTTPKKTTTARRRAPVKRAPARQNAPSADRIREIQQALADRGYTVEPTGVWGPQSVEAVKKFQDDHDIKNLSGRGKLDPLTLIALGLGPKHETAGPQPPEETNPNQEGQQP